LRHRKCSNYYKLFKAPFLFIFMEDIPIPPIKSLAEVVIGDGQVTVGKYVGPKYEEIVLLTLFGTKFAYGARKSGNIWVVNFDRKEGPTSDRIYAIVNHDNHLLYFTKRDGKRFVNYDGKEQLDNVCK